MDVEEGMDYFKENRERIGKRPHDALFEHPLTFYIEWLQMDTERKFESIATAGK